MARIGKRQLVVWLFAAAVGFETLAAHADDSATRRYEFSEIHMGAEIKLVLYAADADVANRSAAAAYARISALDKLLSDYDPQSELSRLSATAGSGVKTKLGDELWFVLERSQRLAAETDGAFDVTVGPLVKAWRSARRTKTFPSDDRLAKARAAVGYKHLKLDATNRTAELLVPGMLLDLGGIAMGYAADEALAEVRRHGIQSAMIDASGDIVCGDAPPGKRGWRIGIAPLTESNGPPSRYVWLANASLTTSGDAFQYVVIDGRRYSHIVDPHSGLGLTTRSSVTVIAPDGITADSLATAVSVLGPQRGLELVKRTPGAAALIVQVEGDKAKSDASPNFPPDE